MIDRAVAPECCENSAVKGCHRCEGGNDEGAKVIYMSPQGRKLDQEGVLELAQRDKLIWCRAVRGY